MILYSENPEYIPAILKDLEAIRSMAETCFPEVSAADIKFRRGSNILIYEGRSELRFTAKERSISILLVPRPLMRDITQAGTIRLVQEITEILSDLSDLRDWTTSSFIPPELEILYNIYDAAASHHPIAEDDSIWIGMPNPYRLNEATPGEDNGIACYVSIDDKPHHLADPLRQKLFGGLPQGLALNFSDDGRTLEIANLQLTIEPGTRNVVDQMKALSRLDLTDLDLELHPF